MRNVDVTLRDTRRELRSSSTLMRLLRFMLQTSLKRNKSSKIIELVIDSQRNTYNAFTELEDSNFSLN